MASMTRRLRAFLVKGASTICLSATVTEQEVEATREMLGLRGEPVVVATSPVQPQFKVIAIKSPTCFVDPDGYTDAKGIYHPGIITLHRRIFLDELVTKVQEGHWEEVKQAIIFFRTDNQLVQVFNYLRDVLDMVDARTAPFVQYTSCTRGQTALVIASRAAELPCILTTQRLEMGVNTPAKKIVIFSRPPDMPHNVVQGMGRAGRPLKVGTNKS